MQCSDWGFWLYTIRTLKKNKKEKKPLLIPHWGNLQTKKPFLSSFNLHLEFNSLLRRNMSTAAPRNVVQPPYTVVLDSSANPVVRDWILEPFLGKRGPRTSGVSEADYTDPVSPPWPRSIPAFPRETNVSGRLDAPRRRSSLLRSEWSASSLLLIHNC